MHVGYWEKLLCLNDPLSVISEVEIIRVDSNIANSMLHG